MDNKGNLESGRNFDLKNFSIFARKMEKICLTNSTDVNATLSNFDENFRFVYIFVYICLRTYLYVYIFDSRAATCIDPELTLVNCLH